MHTFRHIDVGIRSQAGLIFVLTALWWMSLFHDAFFVCHSLFWIGVGYFAPLVLLVFLGILLFSYHRAGRPHKWFFYSAVLAALSPWILFLAAVISAV